MELPPSSASASSRCDSGASWPSLASTFQLLSSVTESLLYLTPEGKLLPWLAESWDTSPDGTTFTFRLRKDVTFQHGEPLTAAVVKWNFDRIVDPNFKAGPAITALAEYCGAEVLDEHTIKVQLKRPNAHFPISVAHGVLSFVSPKAVRAREEQFGQRPVGTGVFAVEEYVSKDHVTLVRNPQNNRTPLGGARGTRVITVETGETQMIYAVPTQDLSRLETNPHKRIETMPWPGVPVSMYLNVKKPPTDELAAR
jgi:peptide/nickel transport system substrate-binding protein